MHSSDRHLKPDLLRHIQTLEEKLWRSEFRFDPQFMDQMLSDDFFEFGRSGRRYRRDEIVGDQHKSNSIEAKIPLPEFYARHITDEVVQVTYVSVSIQDGVVLKANRSSIRSCSNGEWLLRFHQGTAVAV